MDRNVTDSNGVTDERSYSKLDVVRRDPRHAPNKCPPAPVYAERASVADANQVAVR